MNNIQNHRSKLHDSVIDIIKNDRTLMDPRSSAETIRECVDFLIEHYCFLDSSYVVSLLPFYMIHTNTSQWGTTCTRDVMCLLPLLSKVLMFIYGSKQWLTAMWITFQRAGCSDYPSTDKTFEDAWPSCPPPPLVAFAGTLVLKV